MVISWDNHIAEASRRFGVPEAYIRAVMQTESSGDPNAVSGAGAGGLMQVMPRTYNELRGRYNLGPDRFNPADNITAGTAYLRQLNDLYGGDWHKTLYGYNAGPGVVAQVDAGQRDYRPESKAYVDKVLAQFTPSQKGADMPLFNGRTGGATDWEMDHWSGRTGTGGLLSDGTKNWQDGLGTLSNFGQMPSQPPRTQPTTDTTQTDRMDISGRINELLQQMAQPYDAGPRLTPGQYQLAGASGAVGKLAGIHDRRVGIGELLGALGGGLTGGTELARKAGLEDRTEQFNELTNMAKLQGYQRTEAASEAKIQAARRYAAQLRASGDPQMVQLASAIENDPTVMDEVVKAQAGKVWEKDALTAAQRNAAAMGLTPGSPAYNDYIQKSTMPASTSLNIGAQERQEQKDYGTELVKEYGEVRTAAAAAENSLNQIQIARRIPLTTGATAPWFAKVGAVAESLGFNRDSVLRDFGLNEASNAQAFQGVMANLVLTKLAAQKGPQTEADAKRIESTVAQLGNTPEAADFLLRTSQALAQRDIDRRQFYDEYRSTHQNSFDGAGEAWRRHTADMPLVGYNPKTNLPVFYDEFFSKMRETYPQMSLEDIRKGWAERYGGKAPENHQQQQAAAGKAIETLMGVLGPAFTEFAKQYLGIDPSATADQIERAWRARNG